MGEHSVVLRVLEVLVLEVVAIVVVSESEFYPCPTDREARNGRDCSDA